MSKTINEIINLYEGKKIKIIVKIDKEFVYIEGSAISLKFLAQILNAYADQNFPDDFWISPNGPGNRYFKKDSKHGIYFWNTDFDERKIKKKNKSKAVSTKNNSEK